MVEDEQAYLRLKKEDPRYAPKGVWLIVSGGMAKKATGGEWISFNGRQLQWIPEWYARIPV